MNLKKLKFDYFQINEEKAGGADEKEMNLNKLKNFKNLLEELILFEESKMNKRAEKEEKAEKKEMEEKGEKAKEKNNNDLNNKEKIMLNKELKCTKYEIISKIDGFKNPVDLVVYLKGDKILFAFNNRILVIYDINKFNKKFEKLCELNLFNYKLSNFKNNSYGSSWSTSTFSGWGGGWGWNSNFKSFKGIYQLKNENLLVSMNDSHFILSVDYKENTFSVVQEFNINMSLRKNNPLFSNLPPDPNNYNDIFPSNKNEENNYNNNLYNNNWNFNFNINQTMPSNIMNNNLQKNNGFTSYNINQNNPNKKNYNNLNSIWNFNINNTNKNNINLNNGKQDKNNNLNNNWSFNINKEDSNNNLNNNWGFNNNKTDTNNNLNNIWGLNNNKDKNNNINLNNPSQDNKILDLNINDNHKNNNEILNNTNQVKDNNINNNWSFNINSTDKNKNNNINNIGNLNAKNKDNNNNNTNLNNLNNEKNNNIKNILGLNINNTHVNNNNINLNKPEQENNNNININKHSQEKNNNLNNTLNLNNNWNFNFNNTNKNNNNNNINNSNQNNTNINNNFGFNINNINQNNYKINNNWYFNNPLKKNILSLTLLPNDDIIAISNQDCWALRKNDTKYIVHKTNFIQTQNILMVKNIVPFSETEFLFWIKMPRNIKLNAWQMSVNYTFNKKNNFWQANPKYDFEFIFFNLNYEEIKRKKLKFSDFEIKYDNNYIYINDKMSIHLMDIKNKEIIQILELSIQFGAFIPLKKNTFIILQERGSDEIVIYRFVDNEIIRGNILIKNKYIKIIDCLEDCFDIMFVNYKNESILVLQ